jgi:hypothetical protein
VTRIVDSLRAQEWVNFGADRTEAPVSYFISREEMAETNLKKKEEIQ